MPPTTEQKERAAERRAAMREIASGIQKLDDAGRRALLDRVGCAGILTIEGHPLSLFNTCMIAMQHPAATIVGGFRQWKKAGRCVRKGEHGAAIWVPTNKPGGEHLPSETEQTSGEEGRVRFLLATVFDIGQTEEVSP